MNMRDPYPVRPWTQPCRGSLRVPGSKSLTNRLLVLGALSQGTVELREALFSRDTRLLAEGLRALGFAVEADPERRIFRMEGHGGRIPRAAARIDVGNAGTAARFLTALVCLHPQGEFALDGDPEMRRRPMKGLVQALESLGARFSFGGERFCFPFTVRTSGLRGGTWEVDARASSQMLSALLQVAPFAGGEVRLRAPEVRPAFVEMTRGLMRRYGARVDGSPEDGFLVYPINGYKFANGSAEVEPDATAASYFLTLPLVVGGEILVEGLRKGMLQGDTRYGEVLRSVGMGVEFTENGWRVRRPADRGLYPEKEYEFECFSDTFPTLAAVAPFLGGTVRIRGIAHTRHQECDRPAVVAAGLRRCGAAVEEGEAHLVVGGFQELPADLVRVATARDHRMAMSFAVAGCADRKRDGRPWLAVEDPGCCGKTFPEFFSILDELYQKCHD